MAKSVKNSRSAIIITFIALLMGSLSPAALTQQRSPTSGEERRRALESLAKQAQQAVTGGTNAAAQAPAGEAATPAPQRPAPAVPPRATAAPRGIQLNFENADLYDFINQMSSMLGLSPIIVDPEVKGSVNIMSSGPMSKDDILPIFTVILKNNNAALIHEGGTYQIVPISTALKRGVEIIEKMPEDAQGVTGAQPKTAAPAGAKEPAPAARPAAQRQNPFQSSAKSALAPGTDSGNGRPDRLATHVIRVEFVPVRDLIEPIKLFMTEGGVLMPYDRLNMLIITDYTDSVDRILQVIRMLDNSYLDPELVELVKINNNASADVVEDLKKMLGAGTKDSATGISFISLDRLNAIFVMASSKRGLEEVKGWIKELDSSSAKSIQTFIYIVENSTASQIAMMLSALYGGEDFSSSETRQGGAGIGGTVGGSRNQGGVGGTSAAAANSPFGQSGSFGGSQFSGGFNDGQFGGGYGNYGGGYGAFGAGRQLGPQLNVNRTITSQVLRGGQFTGLQDTVRMVVNDIDNSLIIQATSADYAYLRETIRKMDVLPRQVLIDAKIFEVDLTDSLSFGVAASLRAKTDGAHLTTGDLSVDGLLSASTFIPVGNAREIFAALEALRLKTKVKILEAPSVLALDGQMAQIVVGSEYPYPGTSFTPSVGGSTTSVQYRDTGISLLVQPRISASGNVTMDIMQEVSAPGAGVPIGEGDAPSFNKTSVATTLSVKDGETVAIAGLIRDGEDFSRSGVPFLSEIPIVGALFGQTRRGSHRSELIIMITPHVVRTPEKLQEMTQELRDSLRNVRKYADEKEEQLQKDMQDAREDRYKKEQKSMKQVKPAKTKAEAEKPVPPAAVPESR